MLNATKMMSITGRMLLLSARTNFAVRLARAGCSSSTPPSTFEWAQPHNQVTRTSSTPSVEPKLKTKRWDEDLILKEIHLSDTPSKLFLIVDRYHPVMNGQHVIVCFQKLRKMMRKRSMEGFSVSVESETLSSMAVKYMDCFRVKDLLTLLNASLGLHGSSKEVLTEAVYKTIWTSLNNFTLDELIYLQFVFNRSKKENLTPSAKAVRTILPVLFQERCLHQLDTTNQEHTLKALQAALSMGCNLETLEFLATAAKTYIKNLCTDDAKMLLKVHPPRDDPDEKAKLGSPVITEILQACMDTVAPDMNSFSENQIRFLMHRLEGQAFSKPYLDALWDIALTRTWDMRQLIRLTFDSWRHRYFTRESAIYVQSRLLEKGCQDLAQFGTRTSVLLQYLALLTSHDRFLQAQRLEREDTEDEALTQRAASKIADFLKPEQLARAPVLFSRVMKSLALIGIFPKDQLELLFSAKYQEDLWTNHKFSNRVLSSMFDLEQLIRAKSVEDSAKFRLIPAARAEALNMIAQSAIDNSPVRTHLISVLGGNEFLAAGIVTPLGTWADMLIGFRQGDYPIAVSAYGNTGEDLFQKLPPESKLVAIVLTNPNDYLHGTGLPIMKILCQVELLRAQKMCPVVVNVEKFTQLKTHERIPSIMADIKAALESGQLYEDLKQEADAI